MSCYSKIKQCFLISVALSFSSLALANNCGEAPAAPALVDGAKVTMDEIVANSEQVKAYIATADQYLDCREQIIPTEEFLARPEAEQESYRADNKTVLDKRNAIGEEFNAQVSAFKAANP